MCEVRAPNVLHFSLYSEARLTDASHYAKVGPASALQRHGRELTFFVQGTMATSFFMFNERALLRDALGSSWPFRGPGALPLPGCGCGRRRRQGAWKTFLSAGKCGQVSHFEWPEIERRRVWF